MHKPSLYSQISRQGVDGEVFIVRPNPKGGWSWHFVPNGFWTVVSRYKVKTAYIDHGSHRTVDKRYDLFEHVVRCNCPRLARPEVSCIDISGRIVKPDVPRRQELDFRTDSVRVGEKGWPKSRAVICKDVTRSAFESDTILLHCRPCHAQLPCPDEDCWASLSSCLWWSRLLCLVRLIFACFLCLRLSSSR